MKTLEPFSLGTIIAGVISTLIASAIIQLAINLIQKQ